jgi:hypothetical protein
MRGRTELVFACLLQAAAAVFGACDLKTTGLLESYREKVNDVWIIFDNQNACERGYRRARGRTRGIGSLCL